MMWLKIERSYSIRPENFLARIYALLGATGTTSAQLEESLAKTEALYSEVSERVKDL